MDLGTEAFYSEGPVPGDGTLCRGSGTAEEEGLVELVCGSL